MIGKTTMPEFGAFPYTESDSRGITRNPWDPTRTPGGSSGGTAVAVSAGMVPVGMGGDGGGSIRIPSACCGLFGLKPQRGRVTTAPQPHLWWALGTAGPLTRSVLDSALVYDVIRGNVEGDLYAAGGDRVVRRGGGPRAGPAADRLVDEAGDARRPPGPGARAGRARTPRGCSPTSATTYARSTRATPTRRRRSCRSSSRGIRYESDLVEHYDRLERRTRQTYRMGSWVTPKVIDWALAQTEKVSVKANRVFDDVRRAAHARRSRTARPRSGSSAAWAPSARALASMPAIAYVALWNVAGNPAASVPCGPGRRRPADRRSSWSAPRTARPRC